LGRSLTKLWQRNQRAGPEALGPDCAPGFAGFFSAGGDVVAPEAALAAEAVGPACAPGLAGVFCAGCVGVASVCANADDAPVAAISAATAATRTKGVAG